MNTLLVGFGHKARHGKDTVAGEVHVELARTSRLYSMAGAVKAFARVLGMRQKDGPLLQTLGTDVMRRLDPNIWIDVLHAQIEEEQPKIALIPDIRFPNEAEWIKANGGIVIKVSRWYDDGSPWRSPDRPTDHVSETALDDYKFDYSFDALDGDLGGLLSISRRVVGIIRGGHN